MASGDGKFNSEPAPTEYYLDDHAIRLRALEGSFSDLNAQFAANTVQLEGLNDGVARLAEQIGEVHKVVTSAIPALTQEVASLKSIEAIRIAKRDKRRGFISKYASGALVALTAAGLTKFIPFVWSYLHR